MALTQACSLAQPQETIVPFLGSNCYALKANPVVTHFNGQHSLIEVSADPDLMGLGVTGDIRQPFGDCPQHVLTQAFGYRRKHGDVSFTRYGCRLCKAVDL